MNRSEYDRQQAVNWSTLKELARSPAHYRHLLMHPREDMEHLRLGRCIHLGVFEPERFGREVAVWTKKDGKVRRGKKWDAFKAAHEGCEILTEAEHRDCMDIVSAVRADPQAAQLIAGGEAEKSLTWDDALTGLRCKCRLDYAIPAKALVDLKTTARDASPAAFGRESWRYRYHCQMAHYQAGWAATHGGVLLPCYLIAVEKVQPFAVQVYHLTDDLMEKGREEVSELLARLSLCRANDRWPGFTEDGSIVELMPPAWLQDLNESTDDVSELGLDFGAASEEVAQ